MAEALFILMALFFWGLFYFSFARDRSRYRNAYLLFIALLASCLTIIFLSGPYITYTFIAFFGSIFIAILIVPFFLIINGIVMIKREGRSLANLLSLLFGILIGIGEIATFIAVFATSISPDGMTPDEIIRKIALPAAPISISIIYISMSFLIFMIYTLFLQIMPRKKDFDYIIIHGSGLIDGNKVSKLLSDRIDKALEVYRKDPTPPILIPSGGQGGNETVSEARAMADYILSKGIPEGNICIEDKSTTTYENLTNSKAIIEAKQGEKYTALVTSNYHVYRALRYCKKIGLKCTGIGSHVAFYYWPSALIREYVAVHAEPKHLIILVAGWIFFMWPFLTDLFN